MEGEIQMIQVFRKDLGIKAFSLFFAVILWLFVLNNIDNPFQKKNLDVNVTVLNSSSLDEKKLGQINASLDRVVRVEARGRKDKIINF